MNEEDGCKEARGQELVTHLIPQLVHRLLSQVDHQSLPALQRRNQSLAAALRHIICITRNCLLELRNILRENNLR